jgi:hypothetical protein
MKKYSKLSRQEIVERMCNGEIRMLAGRYCGGVHCVMTAEEKQDWFWDKFDDFISGDNDHFDARDFFESKENQLKHWFAYVQEETPEKAAKKVVDLMIWINYTNMTEHYAKNPHLTL